MSCYFQSLTNYLYSKNLLQDDLKSALKAHDEQFLAKASTTKMTFGKYKGASIAELGSTEQGRKYLSWLVKQSYVKEKFQDIYEEAIKMM